MITKDMIEKAHSHIQPYIHYTPVMTSASLDAIAGCSIFFKCENFQKVGAFKSRGAMNAVLSLAPGELKKGVSTHSSGNHAQALARAAALLDTKSYVVMPSNSSEIKKKGVEAYGGKIFECEPTLAAREARLKEVIAETGATEIHPFDNDLVIAGQATAAKELLDQAKPLHIIVTPVGGGGLLSGTSLACYFFSPGTLVFAGEPSGADDAYRSLKSGNIEASQANTIADGLRTHLSTRTFSIIREHVQQIMTVSDQEIVIAMRLLWERMKIIVEPSAAVAFAAVLKAKEVFSGKRVGIILSGGNIDLETVNKLFTTMPGRLTGETAKN